MTLTKLESYKGWTVTRVDDKAITWYCGEYYYQDIVADNLDALFNLIDEIENKRNQKLLKEQKKKQELKEKRSKGIIPVEDFEEAVRVFGFDSPVVTAVWNTMEANPNNQEEFEIIYHRNVAGKYY